MNEHAARIATQSRWTSVIDRDPAADGAFVCVERRGGRFSTLRALPTE
jgi:methylphosphotriester-DNA--protein-cysteine methyltransferase